jgi:hypothetical protein
MLINGNGMESGKPFGKFITMKSGGLPPFAVLQLFVSVASEQVQGVTVPEVFRSGTT